MCEWLVPLAAQALADRLVRAAEAGVVDPAAEQSLRRLEEEHPHAVAEGDPSPIVSNGPPFPYYREQLAAFAGWYRAECGRARSRVGDGEEWAEVAARLARASLPWEAAYAWCRAAESYLRGPRVDRHAGAGALREADARGRQLGAAPLLDRVRRLARTARITLSAPAERGQLAMAGLTRRENEILAHLVVGRTYREIAESLVLSEKTVSSHISNMLRKTGATNRIDLARRATDVHP